jgi:hypothetical protein
MANPNQESQNLNQLNHLFHQKESELKNLRLQQFRQQELAHKEKETKLQHLEAICSQMNKELET